MYFSVVSRVEPCYRHLGEIMRELRLSRGWTQEYVALRLGLTRASVVNIELGFQRVMLHDYPDIASVFGVRVRKLLPKTWT